MLSSKCSLWLFPSEMVLKNNNSCATVLELQKKSFYQTFLNAFLFPIYSLKIEQSTCEIGRTVLAVQLTDLVIWRPDRFAWKNMISWGGRRSRKIKYMYFTVLLEDEIVRHICNQSEKKILVKVTLVLLFLKEHWKCKFLCNVGIFYKRVKMEWYLRRGCSSYS